MPTRGDLILIGSKDRESYSLDYERVRAALDEEGIRSIMKSIERETFEKIASTFFVGNDDLKEYVGEAPLNTDDRPRLEFSAPRYLYSRTTEENLAEIMKYLGGRKMLPPVSGLVHKDDGSIGFPSVWLFVRSGTVPMENLNTSFVVNSRIDKEENMVVGTQHQFQWTEEGSVFSAIAWRVASHPTRSIIIDSKFTFKFDQFLWLYSPGIAKTKPLVLNALIQERTG